MNHEAIEAALAKAEAKYKIYIAASWITGSQHSGLANEDSDIDVTAIYMQDPIELVCQNPSPKDRITTLKVGKVELKLISLTEFGRYIKSCSPIAAETLFYSTEFQSCDAFIVSDLRTLFLRLLDPSRLIKGLIGIAKKNIVEYRQNGNSNNYSNKLLLICAKYSLMASLIKDENSEFFSQQLDLNKIALEDPETPEVIRRIYELCGSPDSYHEPLSYLGGALPGNLWTYLTELYNQKHVSRRGQWTAKDWEEADFEIDFLVKDYYRGHYR